MRSRCERTRRALRTSSGARSAIAGWKFRRQHPIGRYVVDFVTIAGKLIVEVDGATHSEDLEIERDVLRTTELERLGFLVMRVTNLDVYNNLDGVLEAIEAQLSGR